MTGINKKIISALSAAHDFNKAAKVFGGAGTLHQVLRGIAWLDNKNGPVKTDIFRAFSDDNPQHTARRFNSLMDKWDSGTRPSPPAVATFS